MEMEKGGWYLMTWRRLSLKDRLRVLFGCPLVVRFTSPDGACHAACDLVIWVGARKDSL